MLVQFYPPTNVMPTSRSAMTIVTYSHQPKRPKRARKRAAAIAGPIIVTPKSKRTHRQVAGASDEPAAIVSARKPGAGSATPPP